MGKEIKVSKLMKKYFYYLKRQQLILKQENNIYKKLANHALPKDWWYYSHFYKQRYDFKENNTRKFYMLFGEFMYNESGFTFVDFRGFYIDIAKYSPF